MDAEFGTEIGNHRLACLGINLVVPCGRFQAFVEFVHRLLQLIQKAFIARKVLQSRLRHTSQQFDGVVPAFLPQIVIDTPEKVHKLAIPAPKQVISDDFEVFQRFRQCGLDNEGSDRPHLQSSLNLRCTLTVDRLSDSIYV